jgi:type IV secretory pathway VirJ component
LHWGPESHGTLFIFSPDKELESHWIAVQGEIDQVCNCDATAKFVSQVRNGSIVRLPHVGHGFSASRNWLPQVLKSYQQLANIPQEPTVAQKLPDLPLIEIKSSGTPKDILAIMVTGDGGWASLDSKVGLELSQHGIPVVGLNSLHYFWNARTPDQAGQDLNRIVSKYLEVWNKDKVILIGYSFGADVLPFMVNRLEPDLRKKVIEIAFLGPAKKASFEFHITDWLGLGKNSGYPVLSEILKLQPSRILCIAGDQETDSVCKDVPAKIASKMELHGGHHFGGSYHAITSRILEEAEPSLH